MNAATQPVLDASEITDAAAEVIARALLAINRFPDREEFDDLLPMNRRELMHRGRQLLALAIAEMPTRARFNLRMAVRVNNLDDAVVLLITQPRVDASMETRRAMIIRALRIEAKE